MEGARDDYVFLSVRNGKTPVSTSREVKAPDNDQAPQYNLFTIFQVLAPDVKVTEAGFWKQVSCVKRIPGIPADEKLGDRRRKYPASGFYRNDVRLFFLSFLCSILD